MKNETPEGRQWDVQQGKSEFQNEFKVSIIRCHTRRPRNSVWSALFTVSLTGLNLRVVVAVAARRLCIPQLPQNGRSKCFHYITRVRLHLKPKTWWCAAVSIVSAEVNLLVLDPARLVVRPDPSTVVADTRISFFCRADGNPLPNIVWKVNGKPLTDSR